nr:MAG TPA: Ig-like domain protein [Caudoviricetes sp.]
MTVYKWGKFEKKSNYRTKQVLADTSNYANTTTSNSKEAIASLFPSGSKKWGDLSSGDIIDFHRNEVFVVSGINHTTASNITLSGSWYNLEYRSEFSHYSKGSRLETVTSENRNAYPNDGQSGSYWYVYEGIDNQEPTISGQDEDWGGYKQAFKRYYSVDDGDSDQQLNVVVTLNGVTIATVNNATRKTDYPIDIDDSKFNALTLNEQNTIEITVTDSSGATAVRRYTFKRINTAPVVTMTNAHYGEQNKPFAINFEAADPDGDEITAKLFIDDVQIKDLGTIKGKQSITIPKIDFAKIPNGEHKIRVEAKDSYNAVGAGYADFSKNLTYAWYRLKKELSEQPSAVIVNPLSEVAPGAKMTIKVCSNVMDAQPTWETVPEELYGQKYNFRNKSKTAAKWGVGVEIRIDKEKATEESYLYGFVGAYM